MPYSVRSSIAACAAAALFGVFSAAGVNSAASAKDDVAEPTTECRCVCRSAGISWKKEKIPYEGMCRSLNGTECDLPVYGGRPEDENYTESILGRRERCVEIIRKAPRSERPTKNSPG